METFIRGTRKSMTIGTLARSCGIGVETIRYYQRRGLMRIPAAGPGYRTYTEQDAERILFIKRGQSLGFSLDEIIELLALDDLRDHGEARRMAKTKITMIEQRIAQLQQMHQALQHLLCECEHGQERLPCPIIRMALGE
ncbi:MAG: MerR family transcriptional regulator [Proteobacteria bacterium]|nr:MerR family transcriptional regulator [Pseudomonadota bacterium]HQR03384.1 MerR family transcriptional regulator [Rhodocyclaceae bacterium]